MTDEKPKPMIKILDPIALNPNSYESVRLVLRKIGLDAGISSPIVDFQIV